MIRTLSPFFASLVLFNGSTTMAYATPDSDVKSFGIYDRIKTSGVCEEYHLDSLSKTDKQLITKYYTSGLRCPTAKRVGRCIGYKGPDGIAFDMHYYNGTAKDYNWQPHTIQASCKQVGGEYREN